MKNRSPDSSNFGHLSINSIRNKFDSLKNAISRKLLFWFLKQNEITFFLQHNLKSMDSVTRLG